MGCDVIYLEGENYDEADAAKIQAAEERRRLFLQNPTHNRRVKITQPFGAGIDLPPQTMSSRMSIEQTSSQSLPQNRVSGGVQNQTSQPRPLMQINFSNDHHRPQRPNGVVAPVHKSPSRQPTRPTHASAKDSRTHPPAQPLPYDAGTLVPPVISTQIRWAAHSSLTARPNATPPFSTGTIQRRVMVPEVDDRRVYMGQVDDSNDSQPQVVTHSNDRLNSYHQVTAQVRTPLDARIRRIEETGMFSEEIMDTSPTGYRTMPRPSVTAVVTRNHPQKPHLPQQQVSMIPMEEYEKSNAGENERRVIERDRNKETEERRREKEDRRIREREKEKKEREEEDRRNRREHYLSQGNSMPKPTHWMEANRKAAENTYDKVFRNKPGPKIQKAAYMLDVGKMKKNLLTKVLTLRTYSEEVKRKGGTDNLVNCWISDLNPGLFLLMKEKFLNRVYDEEFKVSGHRFILRRYDDKGAADGTVDTLRMRIIRCTTEETAYLHVYLTRAKVMLQADSMFDATQSLCLWLSEKLMKKMFHEMMGRSEEKMREINAEVLRWCADRTTNEKPIKKYLRPESNKSNYQKTDPKTKSESASAFSTITRSKCADIYKTPERRSKPLQGGQGGVVSRTVRYSSETSQNEHTPTRIPVKLQTSEEKSPRRKIVRTPGRELSPGTIKKVLPEQKRFYGVPPGDNRDPFPVTRQERLERLDRGSLKEKRRRENEEKIEEEESWRRYKE